jgi:hypothetical protein
MHSTKGSRDPPLVLRAGFWYDIPSRLARQRLASLSVPVFRSAEDFDRPRLAMSGFSGGDAVNGSLESSKSRSTPIGRP